MKGGIIIKLEELEIIVTAKVEEAVREVMKLAPTIKQAVKQAQEAFSKVNTKSIQNKFQQAVQFMKKKMQDLKKSTQNSEIAIKVNNKQAQQQISQLEKEIDSLQKKITGRELKLNITNNTLDKIRADTNKLVIKDMPNAGNKQIKQETYKRLDNDKNYTALVGQSDKLNKEIIKYNTLLGTAKLKMKQLKQLTSQTANTQNKLGTFINVFKGNLEQAKGSIDNFKNVFGRIPKITQYFSNNIKNIGNRLKQGLTYILKYASSLFSLRSIYSALSNSASAWLSSQNSGAEQLSNNINYLKYSMGSALAPVIQFVTNLVYQLMKAIQSVVYALFKVNIFANASAKSYGVMAGSAKKAKEETKQLEGIHDEINNIQDNDSSGNGNGNNGEVAPSYDLSNVNPNNSIIDAIENSDWYKVGAIIGEKLNEAMNSIPWEKIQEGARKIGTNIAQSINGFVATANWIQIGNTISQALNTAFILAYNFVTTFNWGEFGIAIGNAINGFALNINTNTIITTLQNTLKGIIDFIRNLFNTVKWEDINEKFSGGLVGIFIFAVSQLINIKELFKNNVSSLWKGIESIIIKGKDILGKIVGDIGSKLGAMTGKFGEHFSAIIGKVGGFAQKFLPAFSSAFNIMAIVGLVVAGLGLLQQNFGNEITDILTMITERGPEIITNLCNGITNQLPQLIEQGSILLTNLLNAIIANLPTLITGGINIVCSLVSGISQQLPTLIPLAVKLIMTIVQSLLENLPTIIEAGLELLVNFIQGIVDAIPQLIEMLPTIITTICEIVTQELPRIIEAGIQILVALINGLIECIPKLVEMLPQIIMTIVTTLIENLPTIIDAGVQILIALINGLVEAIPKLIEMLPQIIMTIISTIIQNLPKIIEAGAKILTSLVSGIVSLIFKLPEACWQIITSIGNVLKELPRKSVRMGKRYDTRIYKWNKEHDRKYSKCCKRCWRKNKKFLTFFKTR